MESLSRRNFLRAGSGVAVGAAVGAVSLRGGVAEAATAPDVLSPGVNHHSTTAHETTKQEPVVVFIRDAASGEIAVLVNGDEIVVKDKVLVSRVQKSISQNQR